MKALNSRGLNARRVRLECRNASTTLQLNTQEESSGEAESTTLQLNTQEKSKRESRNTLICDKTDIIFHKRHARRKDRHAGKSQILRRHTTSILEREKESHFGQRKGQTRDEIYKVEIFEEKLGLDGSRFRICTVSCK